MKVKEYRKKYRLDSGYFPDRNQNIFTKDFEADFLSTVESCKPNLNLERYKSLVIECRKKWDNIFNELVPQSEKAWNYFYATVIAPTREKNLGAELKREQDAYDRKKRDREEERRYNEEGWERLFEELGGMFSGLNLGKLYKPIPHESIRYLGITIENISESSVKKSFRILSLQVHPDKGGDAREFQKLCEHKDKCLQYLKERENG